MKPMMNNEFHTYERSNLPTSVLITGGAGFIGSHLSEVLLEQGYRVTIIDNLSTGRFENIAHLTGHPNFRFAIDSITNEIVMDRLVSECSLIFHLAAAVGVKLIVERPVYTIENNVMGTEVVLKTALRYRAKVLIASTSEVYGKGNQIPFCEDDDVVLGPTFRSRWGYAASKMVDEFFALAYHREFGLPVVIFRLFNTVGPRQTGQYGMVIPRFVQTGLRGEPLEVYGDGLQSRCFLHVQDAVAAMVSLAKCPQAVGQVFNVGAVEEITIVDLAKRVLRLIDSGPRSGLPPVAAQPSRPRSSQASLTDESMSRIVLVPYEQAYAAGFDDMRRRVPDLSKVKQYTGWEPKKSLDEILLDVIESIRPQVQVG